MHSFFVTGTDTDVGKTFASAYICATASAQKQSFCYYKPLQCGPLTYKGEELSCGDAALVSKLFNKTPIDIYNSYQLKAPASPHRAFALENRTFNIDTVLQDYADLTAEYNIVLCEGAGGIEVPITTQPLFTIADLILNLKSTAIVIARPELGTINHTLLTLNALKQKGVPVFGFLFSTPSKTFIESALHRDNAVTISEISGVPYLGRVPYFEDSLPPIDPAHPLYQALLTVSES